MFATSEEILQESVLRLAWEILPAEEQWNYFPDFRFQTCSWLNSQQPQDWCHDEAYQRGRERIKALRVVNDTAERGVKLFEEYNQIITRDEEEKQLLLQVVEANRKAIPTETTKKAAVAAVSD